MRTPGFSRTLGGGTLITAVAAARLGARVAVMSALPDGAAARLAREGIVVHDLRRVGEPHAVSVALSTRRDRAFVTFEGVNTDLEARLLRRLARGVPRAQHLHLALGPHTLSRWTGVLRRLRARGVSTSWDFGWHENLAARPGFRPLLGELDWVMVNEAEALRYSGARSHLAALARWRDLARNVVIKRGARGAMAIEGGRAAVRAPAPRVRVVDTTGAGDAFNGGFLAALVLGAPVADCLRAGVDMGSLSTRAPGGLDGLPSRRESSEVCRLPSAVSRSASSGRGAGR